ncbi:hypothetical protein KFK09_000259 [Dendrobium nobile]|uniref:Uncharacterized protein n=1 Tax=Dendrobium nobile TaxID=94219 RepID=A0A8T3C8D6_DENNO|nr:hypothetical protein KFK09_000259 [Dendrobium nobile]
MIWIIQIKSSKLKIQFKPKNPDSNPRFKGFVLKTFFRDFSNTSKPNQKTSDSDSITFKVIRHVSRGNPPNLSPF